MKCVVKNRDLKLPSIISSNLFLMIFRLTFNITHINTLINKHDIALLDKIICNIL